MKNLNLKFLVLILSLLALSEVSAMRNWGAGPRRTSPFLAGAELKVRPLNADAKTDPSVQDVVEIRLVYYRDCESDPGFSFKTPQIEDTVIGLLYSVKKCEYLTFGLTYNASQSDGDATPLCPYNPAETKCDTSISPNSGYRTEVFIDTVTLPVNTDDWLIGIQFSSATGTSPDPFPGNPNPNSNDHRMNWYTKKYHKNGQQCSNFQIQQPQTLPYYPPVPAGLNPPSPFQVRIGAINTAPQGNDPTEAYFYIEATYSNAVKCGEFRIGVPKYCANTTPHSAGSPFLFQCIGKNRVYDLGYYDEDGHRMEFHNATPFKYTCFGDPSCTGGVGDRSRTQLSWAGGCSEDNPLCGASSYNLDQSTGVISFRADGPVGKYKAAMRIEEYDLPANGGAKIGEVFREFAITIVNTPGCLTSNSVTNTAYFIQNSEHNFVNCAKVASSDNVIEACAGTDIKFSLKAYSLSNIPNASLVITGELHKVILQSGGYITSTYVNNGFPTADSATGTLHWSIPANTPPGIYPVIFQIRDCIDGYILSRTEVFKIRVNKTNRISWNYLNFTPELTSGVFALDNLSRRTYNCGSPIVHLFQSFSTEPEAIVNWRLYKGKDPATRTKIDSQPDIPFYSPGSFTTGSDYVLEMVTNQYCNNRDTVCIIDKPGIQPSLVSNLPDNCFDAKGTLEVQGLSGTAALTSYYEWQSLNAEYASTPSYLSNTADVVLKKNGNTYVVYVITTDTCIYPLSATLPLDGIKPRAEFLTDKQYVCPGDTINVSNPLLTTSICSPEINLSTPKGPILNAEYSGTQSNTESTPKIFTTSGEIDRGRTAIIYRASELKAQGFRPGIIYELGFNIDGISDPNIYNNIDIYLKCTDRLELQDEVFEDPRFMDNIYTASSRTLNTGWNDFIIQPFVWDGETNLYFEIWTNCNKPCVSDVPLSPSFNDHLTNYVSMIGKYGNSTETFNNSPVATSNYRHNIRFKYRDLLENITVAWDNPSTLISRTNPSMTGANEPEPKIVSYTPITYNVVFANGNCKDSTTVDALIDTNYKITVTPSLATKCPGDTVHVTSVKSFLTPRPLNLLCGINNLEADSCRLRDTQFYPVIGNPSSTVGSTLHSPFGGVTANIGNQTTDKRIQLLYPYSELKNNPVMKEGYIREIGFEIVQAFFNTNDMLNFSIRMKCVNNTQDSIPTTDFDALSSFEEVFYDADVSTVFGWNRFTLQKPFAWDGKSGIMVDICFDNFNSFSYRAERVRATTQANNRCLYRAANTTGNAAEQFGCTFLTGTLSTIRPNIEFTVCKPTRTPPPVPREVRWAPTSYISNTLITNPIIYNQFTTKYYTILDYVDTTYGKYKVVCRVRDTINSIVDRPYVQFEPPVVEVCEGDNVRVSAGVIGMNQNLYTYQWDTTEYGKVKADYTSPIQIITPPNEGYHYVTVSSINNPNCYNSDSIYVSIQKKKTMPDLGATALLCPGDSVLLSIPSDKGYKNPKWLFNGQLIDTGYSLKVAEPGAYSMIVDSGACTNTSEDKIVKMRKRDTVTLVTKNFSVCEGDSAVILYNEADDVANPVWNTGLTTPYIKVNQGGIYYLVNPRDQYGCLMFVQDTATITIKSNPDFKLVNDTICMSNNEMITLQPVPYDPSAVYTWYPDGRNLASLDVYSPGLYRVVKNKDGCEKEATALVVNDTAGRIDLGKNQAVCCDEVITLDANPDGRKYKGYIWSTGDRSQVIYSKPNASGLYVVEAIKPNGCKDTGSIFIDSKCGLVRAKAEKDSIHIGKTNNIIGEHLALNASSITYEWKPTLDFNEIRDGDKLNSVAFPRDTGDVEYILVMTVTDTNYMPPKEPCVENEVVRFKVLKNQMDTVNIFSPDGDGINDYFYPRIQGFVDFKEIKIYNRYGQLLHDDPVNPWDGKFNNEYQPIGVYVCFISYELHEPRKDKQLKHDRIVLTLIR